MNYLLSFIVCLLAIFSTQDVSSSSNLESLEHQKVYIVPAQLKNETFT